MFTDSTLCICKLLNWRSNQNCIHWFRVILIAQLFFYLWFKLFKYWLPFKLWIPNDEIIEMEITHNHLFIRFWLSLVYHIHFTDSTIKLCVFTVISCLYRMCNIQMLLPTNEDLHLFIWYSNWLWIAFNLILWWALYLFWKSICNFISSTTYNLVFFDEVYNRISG